MKFISDLNEEDVRNFNLRLEKILKEYDSDINSNSIFTKLTSFFSYSAADAKLIKEIKKIDIVGHKKVGEILSTFINQAKLISQPLSEDNKIFRLLSDFFRKIFCITNQEIIGLSPVRKMIQIGSCGMIGTPPPLTYKDEDIGLMTAFQYIIKNGSEMKDLDLAEEKSRINTL